MIDINQVPSPCFVLDLNLLKNNLEKLKYVQDNAGISVILAFKGFAMWSVFPLVKKYLPTAAASSLNEAILCTEQMGNKAHTYSPAYLPMEFKEIVKHSSHITFNSLTQFQRYKSQAALVSCGLRVNPEFSDVETELYNPCAPHSRLGVRVEELDNGFPEGIEGLHFHALCESSSYSLEKVLGAFEERFGKYLSKIKWINMGGGHLITRNDYNLNHLVSLLKAFKTKYNLDIILEPGSAVAWDTGVLVTSVVDIVEKLGVKIAILDISFTCHMPDTLEMPYRPKIVGATDVIENKPTYRLGGVSCLAGDFLSEYSFDQELKIGDKIVFKDMIHYTMVKTTMFNGVSHPSFAIWTEENELEMIREFGYEDYKQRLS